MAFLNSPCHETPKNAIKKKIEQNNREPREKKKNRGKKSRIFCDEPMDFFEKKFFACF
jgi:hypothetical protein